MKTSTIDVESIIATVQNMRSNFQFAQAFDLLTEAAASCGEEDSVEKLAIANGFQSIHRVDRSIQIATELLETATNVDQRAKIWSHLAVYSETVGDFVGAEDAINQCIDLHPDAVEPQIVLARILGHQGEHERAVLLLKHILAEYQPKDAKAIIRIFYSLANECDALGAYDKAFEWAVKAKTVQKRVPGSKDLASDGMNLLARLLHTAKSTRFVGSTSNPERHQSCSNLEHQPVHLIGFPRSGTTLLGQLLEIHPDIHVSTERSVLVDQILPRLSPVGISGQSRIDHLHQLQSLYFRCHLNAVSNASPRIMIDKKPANLPFIGAILELLPTSRFLFALRDPRDVVASCFLRYFPLTDMSANFLSLGTGCLYYATYMQIWRTLKPLVSETDCMQIRYEELCEMPGKKIDEAFAFLNCDSVERELTASSVGQYIHSPTFAEVRKPISLQRCGRWKNYQKHFKPFLKILDQIATELGY